MSNPRSSDEKERSSSRSSAGPQNDSPHKKVDLESQSERPSKDASSKHAKCGPFFKDTAALMLGLLGYAIFVAIAMGVAASRGWTATGGPEYANLTASHRFASDQGSWDYLWKLKPNETTALTHAIPWVLYSLHQIAVWWSIYYAQEQTKTWTKERVMGDKSRYSHDLRAFNWASLGINAAFHVVHFIQTQTQYDALAQDVGISTSQASVIMILVFILLLEWRDRGIAFGYPEKATRNRWADKFPLTTYPIDLVRTYHGYAFAWGAIYTFWYHPMEGTQAHAMGFFLTSMLMLQGSLAYTWAHLNPYWKLLVEAWVTIHGTVVAFQNGAATYEWGRFLFGFAWLLAMTQIFSLPFWKKIHGGWRAVPFIIYWAAVIGSYSYIRDAQGRAWVRMWEVTNIPLVEYGFAGITFLVMLLVVWIGKFTKHSEWFEPSGTRRFFAVVVPMFLVFLFDTIISMVFHVFKFDIGSELIVFMIVFSLLFLLFGTVYMLIAGFCSGYPYYDYKAKTKSAELS